MCACMCFNQKTKLTFRIVIHFAYDRILHLIHSIKLYHHLLMTHIFDQIKNIQMRWIKIHTVRLSKIVIDEKAIDFNEKPNFFSFLFSILIFIFIFICNSYIRNVNDKNRERERDDDHHSHANSFSNSSFQLQSISLYTCVCVYQIN
jgi:hypothetical protein